MRSSVEYKGDKNKFLGTTIFAMKVK